MIKKLFLFILLTHFAHANNILTSIENIPFPTDIEKVEEWSEKNNYLYTQRKFKDMPNQSNGGGHNPIVSYITYASNFD